MSKKDSKDLETIPQAGGLQTIPEDLRQYEGKGGVDLLGNDDVRPPRLLLAQAMSPQVKRSEQNYIPGLQERNLFNSVSGQIYGDGPIDIVVIRVLGARGVQFGEKVGDPPIDYNVRLDDPRMQFTTDPQDPKKRIKPIATKFYDYLVWMPEIQDGPLALSFKGTQLKTAVDLNTLIKYRLNIGGNLLMNPPSWARTFSLGTFDDKRDAYTFAGFTVKLKGLTEESTRRFCAELSEAWSTKNIVVDEDATDRENGGDGKVPF